jgi:hypothetical protein
VIKRSNPKKTTVELDPAVRPSRIRREPVAADKPMFLADKLKGRSKEQEIMIAIAGIVLFALAIDIIVLGISTYWN